MRVLCSELSLLGNVALVTHITHVQRSRVLLLMSTYVLLYLSTVLAMVALVAADDVHVLL